MKEKFGEKVESIKFEENGEEAEKELNEMLSKIDFDILRSVMTERVKELSSNSDRLNFLGREQMEYRGQVTSAACYDQDRNVIELDKNKLKECLVKKNDDGFLRFLHTIIHEECHAISYQGKGELEGYEGYKKLGYSITKKRDYARPNVHQFTSFNEAVTEKLSDEIMVEYAEQSNLDAERGVTADTVEELSAYLRRALLFVEQNLEKQKTQAE